VQDRPLDMAYSWGKTAEAGVSDTTDGKRPDLRPL
jgi:hypothetical protein